MITLIWLSNNYRLIIYRLKINSVVKKTSANGHSEPYWEFNHYKSSQAFYFGIMSCKNISGYQYIWDRAISAKWYIDHIGIICSDISIVKWFTISRNFASQFTIYTKKKRFVGQGISAAQEYFIIILLCLSYGNRKSAAYPIIILHFLYYFDTFCSCTTKQPRQQI